MQRLAPTLVSLILASVTQLAYAQDQSSAAPNVESPANPSTAPAPVPESSPGATPSAAAAGAKASTSNTWRGDRALTPERDRESDEKRAPGDYEHDGFYLRVGLGFGGFTDALVSKDENASGDQSEGVVSSVASVGEFMLGGSINRHFIVGGGLWTSTMFVSNFAQTGGDDVPTSLHEPDNFTIVGPFADWYMGQQSEAQPKGGFHAQTALGVAVLNGFRPEQVRSDDNRRVGIGPGIMVGFGYEWWVHEQWGLGVLARFTAAGLVEEDEQDNVWYHGVATFPAFLFTATYN